VTYFHDVYYDNEITCELTRRDMWLRRRGKGFSGTGRGLGGQQIFELKVPAKAGMNNSSSSQDQQQNHGSTRPAVDTYVELQDGDLRKVLGLSESPNIVNEAVLKSKGYTAFACIVSRRRTLICNPAESLSMYNANLSVVIDDVWFAEVKGRDWIHSILSTKTLLSHFTVRGCAATARMGNLGYTCAVC